MIYVIGEKRTGVVKIGHAADPRKRLRELQTGSPKLFQLQGIFSGERAEEQDLHRRFQKIRVHGEWFNFRSRDSVALVERELAQPPLPLWPVAKKTRMNREDVRAAVLEALTSAASEEDGLVDFTTVELVELIGASKDSTYRALRELVQAGQLGVLWKSGNRCFSKTARYRVSSLAPKQTFIEVTAQWEKQMRRGEITLEEYHLKLRGAWQRFGLA